MRKHFAIAAAAAALAGCVCANTVAFWPLEVDSTSGALDLRCTISSWNDFSCGDSSLVSSVPSATTWNIPSPAVESPSRWIFPPLNRTALYASATGASESDVTGPMMAENPSLVSLMDLRHDFTIEGWVKFGKLPANREYVCLFSSGERTAAGTDNAGARGTWFLSLRHTTLNSSNNYVYDFQLYVPTYAGNIVLSPEWSSAADVKSLTNTWHHIALVFRYEDDLSAGRSQFLFYRDGTLLTSTLTNSRRTDSDADAGTHVYLGSRPNPAGGPVYLRSDAAFDCWRISDAALSPSQFLNAEAGTVVRAAKTDSTIAYWNMGVNSDGTIDLADYAGKADLSSSLFDGGTNLYSHLLPSREKAFSGRPPNLSSIAVPENAGCLEAGDAGSYFAAPGFGEELAAASAFTVEGWVKPGELSSGGLVFGTSTSPSVSDGWALKLCDSGGGRFRFTIESAGTLARTPFPGFSFGPETIPWVHLALVRGAGTWTLYVDGVSAGSVPDASSAAAPSEYFRMFSWPGASADDQFFGSIDCVRIVAFALEPRNFMNRSASDRAEPYTASVKALWMLDPSESGLRSDGTDLVGEHVHSFATGTPNYDQTRYAPAPNADFARPVVTNPDRRFTGNSVAGAATSGCVRFREQSPAQTTANRFLVARDSSAVGAFSAGNDFTFEMYIYRTHQPQTIEALMLAMSPVYTSSSFSGAPFFTLTYKPSASGNGVFVQDMTMATSDTKVPSTSSTMITLNTWHHLAITRSVVPGTSGNSTATYNLYLNGALKGTLSATAACRDFSPGMLSFGGRPDVINTVLGRIGPMRLSNRVLAASEFLNAPAEDPDPEPYLFDDRTLAYWPLEYSGGAIDVSNRTERLFMPTNLLAGVSGSDDACCNRIPRPDTNIAERVETNVGSISLADGAFLSVPNVGAQLSLLSAFTVAGWVKWADSDSGVNEAICGTYTEESADGWQLRINRASTVPRLEILAKVNGRWDPVADAVFDHDVSSWTNEWRHVAVSYEPENSERFGVWRVYENGVSCGAATNSCSVKLETVASTTFSISSPAHTAGAYRGISGNVDQWRISRGALNPSEFLVVASPGFFLMFR